MGSWGEETSGVLIETDCCAQRTLCKWVSRTDCNLLEERCVFADHWELERTLASGLNSEVFLAHAVQEPAACRRGGRGHDTVAVKVVRKGTSGTVREDLTRELAVLAAIERAGGHPNVIHTIEVFEDDEAVYIVMEFLRGGELLGWMQSHETGKKTSERECAHVLWQIFRALEFLHDTLGVAHRDVKPENVMFIDASFAQIKFIDFGSAGFAPKDANRRQYCKAACTYKITPYYAAPEVLFRRVLCPCAPDVWAVGIIMCLMMSKRAPYAWCPDAEGIISQARRGVRLDERDWDEYSPEALHFAAALLNFDPRARVTAAAAQEQPWLLEQLTAYFSTRATARDAPVLDVLCECASSMDHSSVHKRVNVSAI
mmetsp:Transcript_10645/g.28418  ORF Transcript_10645/g.28418 Transcript_10645/m.28418 type:complete len:371 (+) Transcript_10645:155-1267(+)|eukprot:CAMPEP_0185833506 /NCGR_PEP_ID=MMETSP1353-20130828/3005_1 /TAXON_ID=1077150 /ORGANISM="Erythrolobus australicus, Strain CCMP3124" /LENGTH=370 /DNA_ID=CAMNT_0028531805 /DNA_START=106 /DNA_END=1218 /DNA_ORIENTATION=-